MAEYVTKASIEEVLEMADISREKFEAGLSEEDQRAFDLANFLVIQKNRGDKECQMQVV